MIFLSKSETTFRLEFVELWEHLDPDPTVIPRLYRLRELKNRISSSPTALIGVMDLIGSLTPAQDQAVSYKMQIVSEGIKRSRSWSDQDQALKRLYQISERLGNNAFERISDAVSRELEALVSTVTSEAPDTAIEIGKQTIQQLDKAAKSAYVSGVAQGIEKINPDRVLQIEPSVVAMPALFAVQPTIAVKYFEATRKLTWAEEASRELAKGLGYIKGKTERRRVREALLPKAATYGDYIVLKELLGDLPSSDVAESLDSIAKATSGFSADVVRQAVTVEIAKKHPESMKKWGRWKKRWSFSIATIVAASFAYEPQGLDEVLLYSDSGLQQSLLIAAFINFQDKYRMPEWLLNRMYSDPKVFMKLLVNGIQKISEVCVVIKRILEEVPNIPFTLNDSLFDAVTLYQETVFGKELADAVMARVITEYIKDSIKNQEYDKWINAPYGKRWFVKVSYQRLASLIVQREKITISRWVRTWNVLQRAPDTLYIRRPYAIDDLIKCLLGVCPDKWPEEVSKKWVFIIQRAKDVGEGKLQFELSGYALDYSFKHPDLPLSKLVVLSFPIVYGYTMDSSMFRLGSLFSFFSPFSEWDKGKELRRQVVKSFLDSTWPPEDLALAMPDQQTLKKIFKRLRSFPNGERFISEMLVGLKTLRDPKSQEMYRALKEMVEFPDFYEPWI